jgi:hypothetical protein
MAVHIDRIARRRNRRDKRSASPRKKSAFLVPARGYAQALEYCFDENCNGRSSTAPAATLSVIYGKAILLKGQIAPSSQS